MRTPQRIATLLPAACIGFILLLASNTRAETRGTSPAQASFGEVIERQLPAPDWIVPQQFLLDFESGKVLPMPTNIWVSGIGFSPRARYNWMVKQGADLLVHGSSASKDFAFHLDDGRVAVITNQLTFETITASNIAPELARAGVFQFLKLPKPEKGQGATLVFKTREGSLGVMQLLDFRGKPEPLLKLRYKLVRQTPPDVHPYRSQN